MGLILKLLAGKRGSRYIPFAIVFEVVVAPERAEVVVDCEPAPFSVMNDF